MEAVANDICIPIVGCVQEQGIAFELKLATFILVVAFIYPHHSSNDGTLVKTQTHTSSEKCDYKSQRFLSSPLPPLWRPSNYLLDDRLHRHLPIVYDVGSPLIVSKSIEDLRRSACAGLDFHSPALCEEGLGGTYFLHDSNGNRNAVFKPSDEELYCINNPKSQPESTTEFPRGNINPGEGYLREVAAYVLDGGFAGVPETTFVKCTHSAFNGSNGFPIEKVGSFQKFVNNECESWDIGSNQFPTKEVHQVGVLDIRLLNTDRNGGNLLVKREEDGEIKLVPIDHSLSLPESIQDAWFEWLHWSQASKPFDEDTKKFIEDINIEHDARALRQLGLPARSIRTMIISTTLLKKGARLNMTLHDLGMIICREDIQQPSILEKMVAKVEKEQDFFNMLFAEMDLTLESKLN